MTSRRHSFNIPISIIVGTEEEEWGTVTGEYTPALPGEAEPRSASFRCDKITMKRNGRTVDLFPLLTEAQFLAIEAKGVADAESIPLRGPIERAA